MKETLTHPLALDKSEFLSIELAIVNYKQLKKCSLSRCNLKQQILTLHLVLEGGMERSEHSLSWSERPNFGHIFNSSSAAPWIPVVGRTD